MKAFAILFLSALSFAAQTPAEMVQKHIDAAKTAAGKTWAPAAEYFCSLSPTPNRPTDPAIEPTRLFDNVSAIGSVGTTIYVIETSEGLILIDAGYPDQVESVLLAGMKKLRLDPARVRYVLIAHGHSDHFGAAKYLQDTYGAKVFVSSADWDLMATPQANAPAPKRDQVIVDEQPIVLGDTRILPVLVPGHTPGATAFIFPVIDHGTRHTAGLFGGTVLSPSFVTLPALQQYIGSVNHYAEVAAKNKVDVELQNHPLMDGFAVKLAKLSQRRSGDPHPFVVGEKDYAAFLNVISECAEAQRIRKTN